MSREPAGGPPPRGAVFEFAVVGGLGPVLEQALVPCDTHGVRAFTVVRVPHDQAAHADLVDLFIRLAENHIDVVDITLSG